MNDSGLKSMQIMGLQFWRVQLFFEPGTKSDLFALKNNKTVGETNLDRRYASLAAVINARYPDSINVALGVFLQERKLAGDQVYLRFLNSYGDKTYCRFYFQDGGWLNRRGLYCYVVNGSITYVGQSKDSFRKRINQGYGNISPKNCCLDGQATNCHLNSFITDHKNEVELYLCELNDPITIDRMEKSLIKTYQPSWNIALK